MFVQFITKKKEICSFSFLAARTNWNQSEQKREMVKERVCFSIISDVWLARWKLNKRDIRSNSS